MISLLIINGNNLTLTVNGPIFSLQIEGIKAGTVKSSAVH